MLLGRPIAVWAIFGYSALVVAVAVYAVVSIATGEPGTPNAALRDAYGTLGLIVSMIPAGVLFFSGLSLFLLKRWTIWFWALTVLIMIWSVYLGPSGTIDLFWLAAVLVAFAYVVRLRRIGALR